MKKSATLAEVCAALVSRGEAVMPNMWGLESTWISLKLYQPSNECSVDTFPLEDNESGSKLAKS